MDSARYRREVAAAIGDVLGGNQSKQCLFGQALFKEVLVTALASQIVYWNISRCLHCVPIYNVIQCITCIWAIGCMLVMIDLSNHPVPVPPAVAARRSGCNP